MKRIDTKTIEKLLTEFKEQYPPEVRRQAFDGQERDLEHVRLLLVENGSLLDLGGGTNTANLVLARLGMRVVVVDFFEQYWNSHFVSDGMAQLRSLFSQEKVTLISADILSFDYRAHFGDSRFD